ncbi:SRPBCC family protein [Kibdelosporangium philippinense]|uniref:SRPBCC family protein n=1 Tax=Kibdelosporangium philippinense TaxID=211113 RepID=A0ABS8ZFM3_9PSEU|nr:SRPBCC family protein [Kibdelosporangium philippinense]MCE7005710.1 SRPBCC family protein [Kibdelosporangium philippinense]
MTDLIEQINAVRRTVTKRQVKTGEGRSIALAQTYGAAIEDVWDACTNPERLARWFAPVSGDLQLGGRYAIEGNASGTVERCDPPKSFALTWEYDGDPSWVEVKLTTEANGTRFELEHTMPVNDHWELYGPGAGGVGWDLSLASLAAHLAEKPLPPEKEWTTSPEGVNFMRASSSRWGEAGIEAGEDEEWAQAAADRTTAAYTETTDENDQP